MTEGISKETLLRELKGCTFPERVYELTRLLGMCTDLDPWLPIESAPKDRPVLLWNGLSKCIAYWYETGWYIVCWFSTGGHNNKFTHYKLLTEDPK